MWIPPQWRIAFPLTTAVMTACLAALVWSSTTGDAWVAGVSGGIIAGLMLAMAWTLRDLLGPLVALLLFPAVLSLPRRGSPRRPHYCQQLR